MMEIISLSTPLYTGLVTDDSRFERPCTPTGPKTLLEARIEFGAIRDTMTSELVWSRKIYKMIME